MRVQLNLHVSRLNDSYATWMIDDPVLNITPYLTTSGGEVVTERSASNVLTTFQTEYWAEDEVSPIYTPFRAPDSLAPGAYFLWVRIEEEGRTVVTRKLTAITVESGPER